MSGNQAAYQQAMREGHALSWELKWDAAIERYRDAVGEFPDDVVARNSLAAAYHKVGRLDEALAEYEMLLKLTPDDEGALSRVAEIQQKRGSPRQLADAYLALADHYARRGQRTKAVQTWLKLAELLPEEIETHERLYQAVSKAGESGLASKIGLGITRLRGQQAGRSSGQRRQAGAPRAGTPGKRGFGQPEALPLDADLLAAGMKTLEVAREQMLAGRPGDALLSYASAARTLMQAGAAREVAEVERAAAALAEQCGGVRVGELLPMEEADRRTVLEFMVASQEQMGQGRFLAAIDYCLAGIVAVPEYLPLQERLAEAQARQGAVNEAVNRYISLSELYLLRGDDTRASEILLKAAELDVAGIRIWERLVAALLEAGMREVAVKQLLALSQRLLDDGQVEQAVCQLERAAEALPNNPTVLVRLGQALEAAGRPRDALQAYEQVLRADRRHLEAAQRLSIAGALAGAFEVVEEALELVLEAVADGGDRARRVQNAYAAAVARQPGSIELRLCYGMALAQAGNWEQAVGHLQQAARGSGQVAALAWLWLGRFALERETAEAAIRHLAAVKRLIDERSAGPRDSWRRVIVEFQRLWGEVCLRRGDVEKAAAAFGEVRRLAPQDKGAYTLLAEAHFRRGEEAAAVAELIALGNLHHEEGQPERALAVYHGALQVASDNPMPRAKLAEEYLSLGRLVEALGTMRDLAEILAGKGEVEAAVGVFRQMIEHCRESDPARALSIRERIARLLPEDAEARRELIGAYLVAGNADAALAEANQLWHDMVEASRPREAVMALQQVLQIDPWNTQALVALGDLYERMGEHTPAIEVYRRALATDPENGDARARLAALDSR